jgi:hypothetical protein
MARPRKSEGAKRNVAVAVKFTADERAALLAEADRLGLASLSELIRQRALKGRVVIKRGAELAAADRVELNRLGVNLNQLAKHLNAQRGSIAAIDDIAESVSRILAKVNQLLVLGAPDDSKPQ